ncbi:MULTISPECIES: DUF6973 domain-containing protein [unclassified Polaribacter]|uniref:DUF6973 domain-containing protein n=1 Tax=unclassified Polaribacter TaxID=196858 RepID=UPI0011BD47AC|nr:MULTISPECIES: hypothetical protein [unclassified Polaribacter]TXD50759.1 hypothetical protein ES043_14750 [Polaribacter sp. IC063]TXD57457.1 hypothetical protein ES044_15020 [Polaribacter sp. IC066]
MSSKQKKYNFAKSIGDLNEDCGNNFIGTRYMDYRNNEIGRELYQKNAPFKRFFGVPVGAHNPTNAKIYEEAYKQIEDNSVFIDLDSFNGNEKENEEKAYLEIIKVNKDKSIFLSKKTDNNGYYD